MSETMTNTETQELRARFDNLNRQLADMARVMKDKVVGGTKQWAEEHPAAAVGVVAGVAASIGFVVGLMIGRSRG